MSKHEKRLTSVEQTHSSKRKRIVVVHTWTKEAIPEGFKIVPQRVDPPISAHDEVYRVVHTFWSPLSGPALVPIDTPDPSSPCAVLDGPSGCP